ncbi:DNA-directed RNA polymerase subunit A' [Candidatus Hecatella orcuttiae]|jgi:DNA-directed RNA polymerase subunit A'|uniref:DNA-directed RNA polymerase subunit A' n=1 Tax=Candidatus Hecatella orcuttiae TaxID=1935119 RepID=UPI0028680740|nr:DNA-directed RNA polymerase subunit A' [Candidatus Hecatella orcuttiae]
MSAAGVFEEATKAIKKIKFSILSPQEIRKYSVVEIREADTYDEDGAPIASGLMDERLGTLEPRTRCKTCGNTAARCPGHYGHIELATPVIHVGFIKYIHELLNVFCRECGRILLPPDKIEAYVAKIENAKRETGTDPVHVYEAVKHEARKSNRCPHCMKKPMFVEFSKPTNFFEHTEEGPKPLDPSSIRARLELIHEEDLKLLGYDPSSFRPEWMILQVLPVPPVSARPSIMLESGIRSEDDLTHKLVDIIRINRRLDEYASEGGAPPLIFHELSDLLQYHVTTYLDNETSGIPPARHRSGRALRTLSQRLKGKEGRFRSNLSGKRVDFSARTVISPDPNLAINEVGVPLDIAMRLTYPEVVTEWNLEEMRKLVTNGPSTYPGALYVIRPDGKRIRLEFVADRSKIAETLLPLFIVERHLKDGDVVIFNRQPSLHRMSMMAHRVKVLPYKTFRLHLCVCPPYNADFDGDEMNLHVPQTEEAVTEALVLMQVQDQILSPRYGGPLIGAIRDFITGAYLLTRKSTYLKKSEVCSLLASIGYSGPLPEPAVTKPEPLWSGKDIFSLLLPKELDYVMKSNICQNCPECDEEDCKNDAYVVVKNGRLLMGVIDRNAVGAEKSESILHRVVKEYGSEAAKDFLNALCRMVNTYIAIEGFSYSLDELDISEEVREKIAARAREAKKRIDELTEQFRKGTLTRLPGQSLEDSFEIYAMNELAKARDDAAKLADKYFGMDNRGSMMTRSGARGSSLNIGQMTACVGQQSVRGKRIIRGYKDRALTHFKPGDPSPEARGFVYSSYRDGLSPSEFFFHAMGGREGLVDTAVRTQQSGYMQRRLINALQDIRVEYDGTVRMATGEVTQFSYGEDSVDPAKSDHGKAVNIERLIERIKLTHGKGKPAGEKYVESKVESVKSELTPLLVEELRKNLLKAKLNKAGVDYAVETTVNSYKKAKIEPGESSGIIAAQSIGEPGTQMTLRTFHFAGVKERNVTLGLPRIIELVDARRVPSTPIMNIYLKKELRKNREKAVEIARDIVYTTVNNVASSVYIDHVKAAVVVKLSRTSLEERGLTAKDVKEALKLLGCAVKSEGDMTILVKPATVEELPKLLDKVSFYHIKGIHGIRRALVTFDKGEWTIQTDGSNLAKILKVPGVDTTRTTTNNIHEIAATLGIEAARNALINEIKSVLDEQGLDVDVRHVMLVADTMTLEGEIMQIGRHGISGEKASVLAKAAFEITVPTLIQASVRGYEDTLSGVTENVICGQMIPVGTGTIDLYMMPANKGSNQA